MNLSNHVQSAGAAFPASTQRPVPVSAPPSEPAMPPARYDPDAEQFVTELATSLVVLVARWRERASYIRCDNTGTTTHTEVQRCADELEAALREATR